VPRFKRRAENQQLFREVNERIAELSASLEEPGAPQSFVCECGRVGCSEMIEVPLAVYARVRHDGDHYVVLRDHEDRAHEQMLEDHGAFLIVRTLASEPRLAAPVAEL
jgi:hypothetical protein